MSSLKTVTLIQKRPKIVRFALGVVYLFCLFHGLAGLVVAAAGGMWLLGLGLLFILPWMAFWGYLLKMNRDPELVLTSTGFSERTETDSRQFNWSDVERFEVYTFQARSRTQTRVGFNFSNSLCSSKAFRKVRLTARAERLATGYHWHLSNLYGQTPAQLAALMNQYRCGGTEAHHELP